MTVGTQISYITVDGNGVTTAFAYPFNIPAASDAVVTYTSPTGVQTVLAPSLYTLEGTGNPTGGTVTYPLAGSPIPSGSSLTIQRTLPLVQTTSLSNQGPTFEAIESEFDYLTMLIQQLNAGTLLSIQAPPTDPPGLNYILPSAAQRANTSLGFDANGNVITGMVPSGALISAVMVPVVEAVSIQAAFNLIAANGGVIGGNLVETSALNVGGTIAAVGAIGSLGPITAGGRLVSQAGGVQFPDNTVQTTAASGGSSGANPTAAVGLVAVDGTATTYMRSDGAPPLAPTTVAAGTYGSATQVAQITFNAAGQATSASNVTITGQQGNLGGANNITGSTAINSSGFGQLWESTGSIFATVTIPSASGNAGKSLDFWAGQTSSMSLSSASNFVGPFGTGNHQLPIGTNVYARVVADANGQWIVLLAFTSAGTPGGGGGSEGGGGCFLAGTLVTMADGSIKPIEDVEIGDLVRGWRGQPNPVRALHRPRAGWEPLYVINDRHVTSANHPHMRADGRGYLACETADLDRVWNTYQAVLTAEGPRRWLNTGLARERISDMKVGLELATLDGTEAVQSISVLHVAPDVQLYNLVLGGSHTYAVDGYIVTGWPTEDGEQRRLAKMMECAE